MSPGHRTVAWVAIAVFVALALPPLRATLEASMAMHMLVQIPLLAAVGMLIGWSIPSTVLARLDRWNSQGVPGIVLALGISTYWMIPRALDAALASGAVELAKFVSLPLLVGLPLALSWPRLHPIAKGFVAANWIPMLGVVGWLYHAAPIRLCNYYLTDEQQLTGDLLVVLAVALAALWLTSLFWRPEVWARHHSHAP